MHRLSFRAPGSNRLRLMGDHEHDREQNHGDALVGDGEPLGDTEQYHQNTKGDLYADGNQ